MAIEARDQILDIEEVQLKVTMVTTHAHRQSFTYT